MIPDDEPWWKVREAADAIVAAERDDSEDTLQALDALPFRPFTAEW